MSDAITPREFHEADGVQDWRAVFEGAAACFVTGSFATGVALVDEIGAVADAADHHPDVDLRYASVTVRLVSHDVGRLSRRDVALAREISAAARRLGISADPGRVQTVQLTVDRLVAADVQPFWAALLGYDADGDEDLVDPGGRGPSVWFQQLEQAGGVDQTGRNRLHVDVGLPHDLAEQRVAAALAAGGRLVTDSHAPSWWVLADGEGNEACVSTWLGR